MAEVATSSSDILRTKPTKSFYQSEIAYYKMMSWLNTIPDPDELLQKAGIRRHDLRQLELDDEVLQCIDTRREAVVATPWRVEPNQTRLGKWYHNTINPWIDGLKRGVMDARFYGYAVFEIIYKEIEQRLIIERLSLKPMEWFVPQRDGSLRYFPDDGSGGIEGILCDPRKFLLVRCNASYRNPYGEALLSRLWFPVTWRRECWQMWLQFMETFGEPIVVAQVTNYQDFVEAMIAQGVRSTVAWQGMGDDKLQTINASTPGEFDRLEKDIISRIQKLILGQTLTSDVGSSGSYAAAAIHNEVRNDKRRADMHMVQAAGQQLINALAMVNRLPPVDFIMADDAGLELHRAQRDSVIMPVLQASGIKLDREYFLRNYDYNDDELLVIDDSVEDSMDTPLTADQSIKQEADEAPTKDRSVVDNEDA